VVLFGVRAEELASSSRVSVSGARVDESRYMERALELANLSDGAVAPRPPVGAVVVTPDGEVAGEGRTLRKPGPHAEAAAVEAAGDRARGATVYVTLEPCTLAHSKPKSCAQLLIDAGVAKVVASITDPCPEVDGGGFEMLREAGIEVEVGPLADRAAALIEPFAKWITTDEPFVTLKLAASLDGKVAAPDGTSRWITGEASRAQVHDLRRRVDAVVVGSGTAVADDPALTSRISGRTPGLEGDQPVRVVFDSSGRTPSDAQLFDGSAPAIVVTTDDAELPAYDADVIRVPKADGGVDVDAALRELGARGMCHVLVEAGPTLAATFVERGLVDRLILYVAPKIIGGDAPGLFASGAKTLADAWEMDIVDVSRVGEDIRIDARPRRSR
jgi:diaminohydroxyphosphoribosylaminopyrimidine deaminase/5-amino-6-(5-phosphoribosylamino)uracil reductase